jgi:TonB-linked SusC/RagA family outer membrane protein
MKKILLACFALCLLVNAFAQDRVVTGKLTAKEDGSALPGVNVILKGTTIGTVSDADGSYKISVPSSDGTLVFSFIGMETQEVAIGDRVVVDIQLGSDIKQLSEVVVTGAGVATDKKKLGISVESIAADKLPQTPTASIDQALIGKIAGAQISSISGNPGDPVQILLRGINTVQGGTKPMILVDGVQVAATDINSLDLSNIDRVEVVQGAASASLYGAQGANGVIQVFTKKGKKGSVLVNYSTSYSINQYINVNNHLSKASMHPYLTDSQNNIIDYTTGNPLQFQPDGTITNISYVYGNPAASRYGIIDPRNENNKPYNANLKFYDHFKQVFQNGSTQNNSISLSGGGDKSDYSISVTDNRTVSPVLKNGEVDRTNLTVNIGMEIFKGFKLRSITQAIYTKNNLVPGLGGAGGFGYGTGNQTGNINAIFSFLNTSPFFDLNYRFADGTYPNYQVAAFLSVNAINPNNVKEYWSNVDNKIDVVQSFNANYTVNKFLELDAKYGMNYRTENSRWMALNQSQNINVISQTVWLSQYNTANPNGEIDSWNYSNTFQNFLGTAYVRTDFKDDFHSKLPIETSTQISFDYRKRVYKENDYYSTDLPLTPPYTLTSASNPSVVRDYTEPFVTYGYLFNQKINYGNYGGITAGFRSDYSSAFGKGSTPFTFPHVDGFFLPSSLWTDNRLSELLPYFKIRAAYGQAGIQPGPFDRIQSFNLQTLGSAAAFVYQQAPQNPNLQVEVSTEKEVGTDFTLDINKSGSWFNKVNGSFTYWSRTSQNVIYSTSQIVSGGSPLAINNAIGMSSNGVQFSLSTPIYHSENLTWDFTTNWGHQVSKISSVAGGVDVVLTSAAGQTGLVLHPGAIIGQIYGYKAFTNLNDPTLVAYNNANGLSASDYSMVNGRVVLNSTKQIQFNLTAAPIGNPNPKFNSSFINNFSYKNFLSFSFQFDWVNGSHLYNQTKEWMYRDGIHSDFTKSVAINGETGPWTAYWASAYYNLLGSTHGAGNNATKDFFWEDASFWRLRNVSVGIDVAKVANLKHFKKLQLVFTGRNLLTFTNYTGADPEISSGQVNSSFDRGVDHSTIPNIRSYQVGLNVTL